MRRVLTTIPWAPKPFQGQVRDLAVRWALEELALPYEVRLLAPGEKDSPDYRAQQPFGKVPAFEEDGVVHFESGAIVLNLCEGTALMPSEPRARARTRSWLIAALNSVDTEIPALMDIDHFAAGESWAIARRPAVLRMIHDRLADVGAQLVTRDYLVDAFGAADIMMVMVLRSLRHTSLVDDIPALAAYRDRCEARPAFQRALAAQLACFAENAPAH